MKLNKKQENKLITENKKLRKALTNAEVRIASHGNKIQHGTIKVLKNQIKGLQKT